ncbi:MAG: DinB family protein [Chitinophagaceae bacterium]
MVKPDLDRVPQYYHNYINLVQQDNLQEALAQHVSNAVSFLQNVPEDKWNYRYAEGKWSIKEVVQHMIDAERIFCYRALCFARKDQIPLPGFDENTYASASKADRRSKDDLLEELEFVQKASGKLFTSFDEEQLNATGIANENSVYVLAIGFIIAGHTIHHLNILQQRYL